MLLSGFVTWWFVFVATIFAKFTHFGHIVKGFMFALIGDLFLHYYDDKPASESVGLKGFAHYTMIIYIIWWWAPPDTVHIETIPSSLPYVVMASVVLSLVHEAVSIRDVEHALRTLAFKSGIGVVLIVFTQIIAELSIVLEEITIEQSTQYRNVTSCGESTEGIIFKVNTNYSKCPNKLWELLRINLLFGTQLYTLYTLSTAVHINLKKNNHSHPFLVGVAAVTECVALTAAIAGQFDVIHNCHIVTWTTFALIMVSIFARKVRLLTSEESKKVSEDFTFAKYVKCMNGVTSSVYSVATRPFMSSFFLRHLKPTVKLKL